ncbi:hypothetical protein [Streptomyces sp. NPDC088178]|uniref:hypothetical protein n=1 Tax=Streptomyces sp. NPDC088178 TaxID=3365836 RepID=UPI003800CB01
MAMTLVLTSGPVVLWEGTKNVNAACCEVTHNPRRRWFDRVNGGRDDALPG